MLYSRNILSIGLGAALAMCSTFLAPKNALAEELSAAEASAIAEEATIYGLPMLMNYSVLYQYAVDKTSSQYKAPFNQIHNEAELASPDDTAIVTPNSDTVYSFVWMDLRAEPVVLCVPKIEDTRYYSIQLLSLYTYIYGYIGSRATGNDAGCYAIAGPSWNGETPKGVKTVIKSGTEFSFAIYRTQVFGQSDLEQVKAVQAKYSVQTLSEHNNTAPPAKAPAVDWLKFDPVTAKENPFNYLAFILQFAPAIGSAEVEIPLRERFAKIGIEPGKPFPSVELSSDVKAAIASGIESGAKKAKGKKSSVGNLVNGWQISEGLFGSRTMLQDNYLMRAAAAMVGLYGNDSKEAFYPLTKVDANGVELDGSKHNYTLTFPADGYPPVNAFWSVTMYDGDSQLLIKNPINRYLVNSPMLSEELQKNSDGSLTLFIQNEEPKSAKGKANWLPAPDGPIYMVMRLYWPKNEALDGSWQPPGIEIQQ
ncbi:DUF1254 domain-containing protein [Gilvimarinus sp. SDUM040013]|uniref:DUF1254 domain-containing protein n=1 Tax=Gilvimarinus gilvus TaxID=3058038 RepID=A0ABU4S0R4_9GAMM|nr:DUF1254 domain-containing protein [Gilvimarinus sp. SDUM040013]MDO3385813.1 DUF1254 domain-containing protein [Gilvimarinus sp. SDUM040013]MDX6850625.1 DUF1254 domain-containing protein [Gilvimarinus sp. SDUM040013]